jgi:hypothetical protein
MFEWFVVGNLQNFEREIIKGIFCSEEYGGSFFRLIRKFGEILDSNVGISCLNQKMNFRNEIYFMDNCQ